jgi:hypothetical protein
MRCSKADRQKPPGARLAPHWDSLLQEAFTMNPYPRSAPPHSLHAPKDPEIFDLWLASRTIPGQHERLVAGAQRPITLANLRLAYVVLKNCALNLVRTTPPWHIHLSR